MVLLLQAQLHSNGQYRAAAQQQSQRSGAPEQTVTDQFLVLLPAHNGSEKCQHGNDAEDDANHIRRQFPPQRPGSQIQQEADAGEDRSPIDPPRGQRSFFRILHVVSP